jgi:hypothetical protein
MRPIFKSSLYVTLILCLFISSKASAQNPNDLTIEQRKRIGEDVRRAKEERKEKRELKPHAEKRDSDSMERLRKDVPRIRRMQYTN